jgi:superfamily I DNA/RNA helicase
MPQDIGSANLEFGRRCEAAWRTWLLEHRQTVTALCEATDNARGTTAPLIEFGCDASGRVRAPDFRTDHDGESEYWEVKGRQSITRDPGTALSEQYIEHEQFKDYESLATRNPGVKFWIVVYEAPTATAVGRWLKISLQDALSGGRLVRMSGQRGEEILAWRWPTLEMTPVTDGPAVDLSGVFEQRSIESAGSADALVDPTLSPAEELELIRHRIGLPHLPRYSILRVGELEHGTLLRILDLGIRVFLLLPTDQAVRGVLDDPQIAPFADRRSRLLEVTCVGDRTENRTAWVCDGKFEPASQWVRALLDSIDAATGLNARQYHVIHEAVDADVQVVAGAGTGKTETLAERIMFLLSTSIPETETPGDVHRYDVRLPELALITFTKEAANEIRARLARTLTLRRRMCRRILHPVVPWMTQLGQCQISTIHTFAKRIVQAHGSLIRFHPGFRVAKLTQLREELIDRHLSELLREHDDAFPGKPIAFHEWRKHIIRIWESLEENGVSLIGVDEPSGINVDWGTGTNEARSRAATTIVRECITRSVREFSEWCVRRQSLPTGQLIPAAILALSKVSKGSASPVRFLFVDEFQDTDPLQMQLLLEIRRKFDCRLYVVGDSKQGIYRFRGAEGDAFRRLEELRKEGKGGAIPAFRTHRLVTNFRSLPGLLEHFDRAFESWGSDGHQWLGYRGGDDRLMPGNHQLGDPQFLVNDVDWNEWADRAADWVCDARRSDPSALIAVLCRRNSHARAVHRKLCAMDPRKTGDVELLIGGSFFASRAVAEARALMQALAFPDDMAALAELLETRWGHALASATAPPGATDPACWKAPFPEVLGWRSRLGGLAKDRRLPSADIRSLQARIRSLLSLAHRSTALAFLVRCKELLNPASYPAHQGSNESGDRYGRNLDHLLTIMDEEFDQSPASLMQLLGWLQFQAAVNRSEDEPPLTSRDPERKTLLMTVHASKGREFDFVLVPNTFAKFSPPSSLATTEAAVMVANDGTRRLLWRWPKASPEIRNVPEVDALWDTDRRETIREEARLLYVALTRAKRRVTMFRTARSMSVPTDSDLDHWKWQVMIDAIPRGGA